MLVALQMQWFTADQETIYYSSVEDTILIEGSGTGPAEQHQRAWLLKMRSRCCEFV